MTTERAPEFQRNPLLEEWLQELSHLLEPAEERALARPTARQWPVLLVVGAPRSGTTLLMQWLAGSGGFSYPSNLLARFAAAPLVGARIQRLLTDPMYAFRDELFDLANAQTSFSSELGKTRGALAPNEFWYMWRRFLPTTEIEPIAEKMVDVDIDGLRLTLNGIADIFQKPLALKGMMVMYDIEAFSELVPETVFLCIERDRLSNARSLLSARERFFGDRTRWYSAKPMEHAELVELSAIRQVAAQVHHTQRALRRAMAAVGSERALSISYEEHCADPSRTWDALRLRLPELSASAPEPDSFTVSPERPLDDDEERALCEAFEELEQRYPLA